jgi:hypothetical protein
MAFGVLATLVLLGVMGYCLVAAQQALHQEADRRAAGSLIWIATPVDPALPLDGRTCTNLGSWPGVVAAGGVASRTSEPIYAYPGSRTQVPVAALTPGALRVFVPEAPAGTVALGGDLIALGTAAPGQWLYGSQDQPVLRPTLLVSSSPLGLINSTVITTTLADTDISTCWIRMEPGAVSSGNDVLSFAFPSDEAFVTPFLENPTGVLTPSQQWRAAIGAHPWLIGAAVIAASAILLAWTRRAETAVYRTFGTTRTALTAMTAVELATTLIPSLAAAVLGASVLAAARWGAVPKEVVLLALAQGAAATITGLAIAAGVSGLLARGDITQALRDR